MVNVLSTMALVLSIGGQFLLAKQKKIVFPIWMASNILWIAVNILSSFNLQQVIMYVVYTGFNFYSWYSWSKKEIVIQN